MNTSTFMQWLIVIVGILALAKGIWMIVRPQSASDFLKKWINMPDWLLKTISVTLFIFGIICVIVATINSKNYKIAATLILGTIFIVAGLIYHSRETFKHLCAPWTKGNKVWMGIWGVISIIIAAVLLWIGIFTK